MESTGIWAGNHEHASLSCMVLFIKAFINAVARGMWNDILQTFVKGLFYRVYF